MKHLYTALLLLMMLPPAFAAEGDRPGLSRRDRSLVIVSALIAMNMPEQLRSHLGGMT